MQLRPPRHCVSSPPAAVQCALPGCASWTTHCRGMTAAPHEPGAAVWWAWPHKARQIIPALYLFIAAPGNVGRPDRRSRRGGLGQTGGGGRRSSGQSVEAEALGEAAGSEEVGSTNHR